MKMSTFDIAFNAAFHAVIGQINGKLGGYRFVSKNRHTAYRNGFLDSTGLVSGFVMLMLTELDQA
ncbi:MAG: hypothetical protein GXP08_00150 [Gammaproteobacteria bacterium]|nr:hypothetical protein [Gammaproteobacteria bacterium]